MKVQSHFLVEGRVQGVFYRASASDEAIRLGLSGWVRNRRNGSVELVACGQAEDVDRLEAWLWQGPRMSNVTSVIRTQQPVQEWDGPFRIKSTT
jgi:acylphosphatase